MKRYINVKLGMIVKDVLNHANNQFNAKEELEQLLKRNSKDKNAESNTISSEYQLMNEVNEIEGNISEENVQVYTCNLPVVSFARKSTRFRGVD